MRKRMKHVCIWVAILMLAASLTVLSAGGVTEDSTSTEESEGTVFDECDGLIAEILDELLTRWKSMGYRFCTLEELFPL